MAYVITGKCIQEVYAACVAVCPADCIHFVAAMPQGYPSEGSAFMVVDPDECIDCSACLPECPIGAIVETEADDPYWAEINKNLAPSYVGQRTTTRPKTEAPRRADNKLIG
jgi:ferredoxin